jgi:hypothetical protein
MPAKAGIQEPYRQLQAALGRCRCMRAGETLAASLLHNEIIPDLFDLRYIPRHRDGPLGLGRAVHKPA